MRLKKLINKIENDRCLIFLEYVELKKRIKQVKIYFNFICKDNVDIVGEVVGNAGMLYYVNMNDTLDLYDFLSENDLLESSETGHLEAWVI